MSVLIKEMKMPKNGFVEILIRDDGTVQLTGQSCRIGGTDYYYTPYDGEMPIMYEAVPVPEPHGRLIDADAFIKKIPVVNYKIYENIRTLLENAPTIIPSSETEE